jgi:hypothetical protein
MSNWPSRADKRVGQLETLQLFSYMFDIFFPGGPSLFGVLYLLIPKGLLWHEETLASKPSQYTPSNWFGDSEEPADDNGNIR